MHEFRYVLVGIAYNEFEITNERMRSTWYPGDVKGNYFFYRFAEEINIGPIRKGDLLREQKARLLAEQGSFTPGEPMFLKIDELINYRDREIG